MDPIRVITGTAVPLDRSDVDTDQIIPSDWLKRVERTGFGAGLFAEWRDEREFVLNQPQYAGASILVAGPNFGTGSSREDAVWALTDYGFKAVVSSRFGGIFRNNATKSGLVPVVIEEAVATSLMRAIESDPSLEVTVDVERRTLSAPKAGIETSFTIDEATKYRLINGLDDIAITLQHEDEITRFETRRSGLLPSVR